MYTAGILLYYINHKDLMNWLSRDAALVALLAALLASSTQASGGTSSIAISAGQKHFNEDGTDV